MGIPIGKLSLYTACGEIHRRLPCRLCSMSVPIISSIWTIPCIWAGVTTYQRRSVRRVYGHVYQYREAALANVLLQFEDFAQKNATRLLQRYRDQLCCFNDDIQGTAAVTAGTLIAAAHAAGTRVRDQRVVFLGADPPVAASPKNRGADDG